MGWNMLKYWKMKMKKTKITIYISNWLASDSPTKNYINSTLEKKGIHNIQESRKHHNARALKAMVLGCPLESAPDDSRMFHTLPASEKAFPGTCLSHGWSGVHNFFLHDLRCNFANWHSQNASIAGYCWNVFKCLQHSSTVLGVSFKSEHKMIKR